jgi:ubiquinone/menaquinone biosynthesis C-methylase UbiE
MEKTDELLSKVSLLKACRILDVGCGCGEYTIKLSPFCRKLTAIDFSQALIERCRSESGKVNIEYVCMDGRDIRYPDNSFDVVLERDTLHHVLEWQRVLDEMIRVSAKHILVEEPLDDPRSEQKKNSMRAQEFFLELQNEVGFTHYKYIFLDSLTEYFRKKSIPIEVKIIKSDKPVDFDKFFSGFTDFAEKSKRKEYWYEKLENLRKELTGKTLAEEDVVFIEAVKP